MGASLSVTQSKLEDQIIDPAPVNLEETFLLLSFSVLGRRKHSARGHSPARITWISLWLKPDLKLLMEVERC
jgi:hypothetical protein